ncbi:MAG: ABC transporter ATP-binding protein [Zestosphaera sp.]
MMVNNGTVVDLKGVTAGYLTAARGWRSLRRRVNIVLNNVSLKVSDGERLAIIGESGSGKSTLLKVILGLLKPLRGGVTVLGKEIYTLPWSERIKVLRAIGYVPQDPYKALNPSLRVMHSLMEPLEASKIRNPEGRISEVLRLVQLPEEVMDYYPTDLSGGMRQRILIARAVIHDPEILALDEPTSALDVSIQAQIINLINDLHRKLNLTVMVVTHDLGVAQYLADRVVILYKGEVVEEGSFEDVLHNPRNEYTKLLIRSYRASI